MSKKRKRGRQYKNRRRRFLERNKTNNGWICVVCGVEIENPLDATIEHIIPIYYGIVDELDESNWTINCSRCNSAGERNMLQSVMCDLINGLYNFADRPTFKFLEFEHRMVEKLDNAFVETA